MTEIKRLYIENDRIRQELDDINRRLSQLRKITHEYRELNLIVNSDIVIGECAVTKGDMLIVKLAYTGTTNSVGNAIVEAKISDNVLTERSIVYRDQTSSVDVAINVQDTGNIEIGVRPLDELVPLKIDNLQVYKLCKVS